MDILPLLLILFLISSDVILAAKLSESLEKFYTTDVNYEKERGQEHSAMGISTLAKFSMLSNTPTLFKVRRPGLDNHVNTLSLESIQKPGFYLRYKNYKFHMEKDDGSLAFKKDTTFRERLGPHGRAYELLERDNWFMCHTDTTPYTLKARSERIGTHEFVNNCVYVPVKQDITQKKNIVKTLPSGGAMVVNHVPSTGTTDKCISIRFINNLGGPVRVVSSLKPQGYLVTANAFKLKTIFKHANHRQRHVIFYAENVEDRDDDVMLNDKNVFTMKPHECQNDFRNVILSSHSKLYNEIRHGKTNQSPLVTTLDKVRSSNLPVTSSSRNFVTAAPQNKPAIVPFQNIPSKRPGIAENLPGQHNDVIGQSVKTPVKILPTVFKDLSPNVPVSAAGLTSPVTYHATPKPIQVPDYKNQLRSGYEIGISKMPSLVTPRPQEILPSSYTAPLTQELKNLDSILEKRIQTQEGQVTTPGVVQRSNPYSLFSSGNGYEPWSAYSPCSVTCGVGMRRRTRICAPGTYCFGPAAEIRPCIQEQCASNCIHTSGGSVRDGSCCHFPFSYNGGHYYHCILSPMNNERMWCSTTPYFEQDKQWGYCPRSAKAPIRSFVKPVASIQDNTQPIMSTYNTNQYYNNPDIVQDDSKVVCNAMCSRVCDASCPKHCCLSVRANLPFNAYLGANYDINDKRSSVYQQR